MVILCREGERVEWMLGEGERVEWMQGEPKYRTEKEEEEKKDMFVGTDMENVILVGQDGRVEDGKLEKCVVASKSILASVRYRCESRMPFFFFF